MKFVIPILCGLLCAGGFSELIWEPLPPLPYQNGVAGAFAGAHNGVLIAAGGADFPVAAGEDLWAVPKKWHAEIYVLTGLSKGTPEWRTGFHLDSEIAYGASASTSFGVVCLGGDDGTAISARAFILQWDGEKIINIPLPDLPQPCAYGAAAVIGNTVYLAGGQSGSKLESALQNFWSLDLSKINSGDESFNWQELPAWPGPARAFNLTVAQHNGFEMCVYVISGRWNSGAGVEALNDVYEYSPSKKEWRRRTDVPAPVMAGTGAASGQSHIFILSGADGSLFGREAELKNSHPGFPKRTWAYHTITDTWIHAGETPCNQVTTPAVKSGEDIFLISGESRPRVRTPDVWRIQVQAEPRAGFGAINFTVLIIYLLGVTGVGFYFMRKNKNTNDYFRGGQQIPWWVAGCSIFATMLSSITFMAIPAKAYAQDWLMLLGNFMIVLVAPVAVYLALPFFRRIDATSAYEYLEKRFNRPVRLLASGLFSVFHVFRMGIVMSLAGLALATLTPLTPAQSVLIMGVLSMLYCTVGGLEAVVWTDTIQTFVLLGGALLCLILICFRLEDGAGEILTVALADGKLRLADLDFSITSYTAMAVWVVVIGGIGQNISSYIGDQAVVQRYMSTPDRQTAARSIWTNAVLTVPASLLFFGIGTALYTFYKKNPALLDPTINTDQIFPLFISTEVPAGIAGLIVAGVFAAAQSTISTSMNSTATTIVTDFLQPFNLCRNDRNYLRAGQIFTFVLGLAGTLIGLLFVHPAITSLFDAFITVIGLFMGVLGGVFCLGMLTRRANGKGTTAGTVIAVTLLWLIRQYTPVHWFLYSAIGIALCFVFGYLFSLILPAGVKDIRGLTVFDQPSGND
ncbi:MAG: sodium/solute symporter [Kiritimatiellales bacterium]